jgi:hypothetical protein
MAVAIQDGTPGADGWRPLSAPAGFAPTSIACPASGDCWAAGGQNDATGMWHLEHGVWTAVSTEDGGGLRGISCVTRDECWAVGQVVDWANPEGGSPLVERWNGADWAPVAGSVPAVHGGLGAVTCITALDCWAVGQAGSENAEGGPPLIEHYQGGAWLVEATPAISGSGGLWAVACVSAHDCVAVGWGFDSRGSQVPLIEQYEGDAWTPARVPPGGAGPGISALYGVACVASGDCWAVGDAGPNDAAVLVRHPNRGWRALPLVGGAQLLGVACAGAGGECWGVGWSAATGSGAAPPPEPYWGQPLVERRSGDSWTALDVSSAPAGGDQLLAVACTPGDGACYAVSANVIETNAGE